MTTLLETHEHWGGGWWFFAPLLWIAMFILLISLLRALFCRRHRSHWHGHQARSLLAERYAKGEIDEDEYQRRKAFLENPRG